ncbi:hypothetical protein HK405_016009, partial [Cladochytrium tenue]
MASAAALPNIANVAVSDGCQIDTPATGAVTCAELDRLSSAGRFENDEACGPPAADSQQTSSTVNADSAATADDSDAQEGSTAELQLDGDEPDMSPGDFGEPPPQFAAPMLSRAAGMIGDIKAGLEQVKQNKHSIQRLLDRADRLLAVVDAFLDKERLKARQTSPSGILGDIVVPNHIRKSVQALTNALQSIDEFVRRQSSKKFMQNFVSRQSTSAKIDILHQELAVVAHDLSLSLEVDSRAWADEDRQDRENDKVELELTLQHLIDNDYKILNALELKQQEYLEAMEALQKTLAEHLDRSVERNLERLFMERALTCLRRASQTTAPTVVHDWVITSWEIEIGDVVNRGGFGEVAKATWLGHTSVAIKRLLIRLDTNRLREDFNREVRTWYPLRHPHILPLLGACATADRPFMVMPFMDGGHSIQYLDKHPNDPGRAVELLYEISQGMQYLHSRHVIHGDLKAVNVLVDEFGRACVADFGFATLKKITSTRRTSSTGTAGGSVAGTLRWMAPERLLGGPLTQAVDVYAFAMTCFEVVSDGDIPLTDVPDALVYQFVVERSVRPVRPERCPQAMWDLMVQCWHPDPLQRPSFAAVSVAMKSIVAEVGAAVAAISSPMLMPLPRTSDPRHAQAIRPRDAPAGPVDSTATAYDAEDEIGADGTLTTAGTAGDPSHGLQGPPPMWAAGGGGRGRGWPPARGNGRGGALGRGGSLWRGSPAAAAAATEAGLAQAGTQRSGGTEHDSGFGSGASTAANAPGESDSLPGRRPFHFERSLAAGGGAGERSSGSSAGSNEKPDVAWAIRSPSMPNGNLPLVPPDDLKLKFEDGTWGAWLMKMVSAFPASVQADVQKKMVTIGYNLNE